MMKLRSKLKSLLALVLALLTATTGCTPQWINVAVQDLPVLTQMALNIATLVSALASGKQASAADVAVIQNISAQASRDLNLLQTLYNEYKANPSSALSHELLEMLADPWINWCAMGSDNRIYALEVCDAVEDDRLGYKIDGVLVSDFITPAWFERTDADRLDFSQHLSKQLELARGGYISVFDPSSGWTQIDARGAGGPRIAPGSRRQRRKLIRPAWRNSLR